MFLSKIILFTASKSQKGELFRDYTEGGPNLSFYRVNTILFCTVPYRFQLEFLSRSRSLFERRMLRFFAKKAKSANRIVFKIKTVLSF
jgi:hypothetical protein